MPAKKTNKTKTAKQVQATRNGFRVDEIMAVLDADPTLTAAEVIEALDRAKAEFAANVAADR